MKLRINYLISIPSIKCHFCIGISLLFISVISFQVSATTVDYKFGSLSVKDGLTQSSISALAEDQEGYLWIGTEYGLNRYDGVNIKKFYSDRDNPNSLQANDILKLLVGSDSTLWVLTSKGLDSIDTKTLKVTRWSELIANLVFEGEAKDFHKLSVESIDYYKEEKFIVLVNGMVLILNKNNKSFLVEKEISSFLNNKVIYDVSSDQFGDYIIELEQCFWHISKQQEPVKECLGNGEIIYSARFIKKMPNKILLLTNVGFSIFDSITHKIKKNSLYHSITKEPLAANDVLVEQDGYWVATDNGLKFWSSIKNEITKEFHANVSDVSSIQDEQITSLVRTSDGIFWLGNNKGVNYWHPNQPFENLMSRSKINGIDGSNLVTSISQDLEQNVLLGTNTSGLFQYSKNHAVLTNHKQVFTQHGLDNIPYINKIKTDKNFNLLILTDANFYVKNYDEQTFSKYELVLNGEKIIGETNVLYDFIQDQNGSLWIVGSLGLVKLTFDYNKSGHIIYDSLKLESLDEVLPDDFKGGNYYGFTVYEDLQGYIWLGGSNGLVRLNPETYAYKHFTHEPNNPNSLSDSEVNVIYEDLNGILWIGTSAGLNRVIRLNNDDFAFKQITKRDGLVNDYICSILADNNGYLWISTLSGLIKYHPDRIGDIQTYTENDGLQHNEFYVGSQLVDRDGNMYFGGINGVSYFNPNNLFPPRNKLDSLYINIIQKGSSIEIDNEKKINEITVEPDAMLFIELANFDYLNSKNHEYRYKLKENSSEWIVLNKSREITLPGVESDLNIQIQVRSFNGPWSENIAQLIIKTKLYFWKTGLGYFIIFFIISFLVLFLTYKLYKRYGNILDGKELLVEKERGKQKVLFEEKKSLVYQVEDLQYSLSEQQYVVEKLNNEIEQHTISDVLTGFYTREYLKTNIKNELLSIQNTWIKNTSQKGAYLGVFVLEIDGFSNLNNDYGHLSTNEILRQVAEILRTICYGTDILCRWTESSIVILSRGISEREQMILAERMRNMIASRKFDLANGGRIDLTCSLGFTRFPFIDGSQLALNWSQLIYIAKKALLVAQKNSLNAWIGIFANQFTEEIKVNKELTLELVNLIHQGQLDHVSSIPKSKKLTWD